MSDTEQPPQPGPFHFDALPLGIAQKDYPYAVLGDQEAAKAMIKRMEDAVGTPGLVRALVRLNGLALHMVTVADMRVVELQRQVESLEGQIEALVQALQPDDDVDDQVAEIGGGDGPIDDQTVVEGSGDPPPAQAPIGRPLQPVTR